MPKPKTSPPPHDVGYRKPPEHSRFKPGQSGNPKGRPKGVRNLRTDVKHALSMPVILSEDGRRKRISTQAGGLLKLREKALKGDARALDLLLQLAARYNDEPSPPAADSAPSDDDQAILADYVRRHAAAPSPQDDPVDQESENAASGTDTTDAPASLKTKRPKARSEDAGSTPPAGKAPNNERD